MQQKISVDEQIDDTDHVVVERFCGELLSGNTEDGGHNHLYHSLPLAYTNPVISFSFLLTIFFSCGVPVASDSYTLTTFRLCSHLFLVFHNFGWSVVVHPFRSFLYSCTFILKRCFRQFPRSFRVAVIPVAERRRRCDTEVDTNRVIT